MKIIEIKRFADAPDSVATVPGATGHVDAVLLTDSSCVLPGRPLFVPEFSRQWELYLAPAVRVSRLGKFIGERFARRYYDAVSVVARLRPLDNGCTGACAEAFDSAMMLGEWVSCDGRDDNAPLTITMPDGRSSVISAGALGINRAVSRLSESFTLKTGDIIIPGRTSLTIPVILNTRVEASLDGQCVVQFNIK